MPQTSERKREYMRSYQKAKRGVETAQEPIIHEHYWLRDGGFARCVPYHFQHRDIGGCGEIREYTGRLFPSFDDNDLVSSIAKLSAKTIDRWLAVPGPINTGKHPQRDAP